MDRSREGLSQEITTEALCDTDKETEAQRIDHVIKVTRLGNGRAGVPTRPVN